MRIGIVTRPYDLSLYVAEIFQTWGFPLTDLVAADEVAAIDPSETPVLIAPAGNSEHADAFLGYAKRGGTLISFCPAGKLSAAGGIDSSSAKETPLRLRLVEYSATGIAGESIPVVGEVQEWGPESDATVLGYLSHPAQYEDESVGIIESSVGRGKLVLFALDLPLAVLLLRQGDPSRAEFIPEGDGCARPSHLASEIGPRDTGWIPFADLLARALVDLALRNIPSPIPQVAPLPASARGILLYSGDEDFADVEWNDDEFDTLTSHDARMNLYIIPIRTKSTTEDVARYLKHHDLGPHPDLRPLDGKPVSERIEEFRRQIRMFKEMFGLSPKSIRNHCTAWAGYMDPIEVEESEGIRMDANYFSGSYKRDRDGSPYGSFGGALPMKFCHPDGRLLDVYQQHTHLTDDGWFGHPEYSYKLSPEVFSLSLQRIFTDIATRFHTPYGVCIHPSNWVKFSGKQGRELLRQAKEFGFPIWSFDDWVTFWESRATLNIEELSFKEGRLRFRIAGETAHDGLRLSLPLESQFGALGEVTIDCEGVRTESALRHGSDVALLPLPKAGSLVAAEYT